MRNINPKALKIIENIEKAVTERDYNRKVNPGDPIPSESERKRLVESFIPKRGISRGYKVAVV